jgi:hypothetical protein
MLARLSWLKMTNLTAGGGNATALKAFMVAPLQFILVHQAYRKF